MLCFLPFILDVTVCNQGEFKCRGGSKCIPSTLKCNGENDCGDFSDEKHCGGEKN